MWCVKQICLGWGVRLAHNVPFCVTQTREFHPLISCFVAGENIRQARVVQSNGPSSPVSHLLWWPGPELQGSVQNRAVLERPPSIFPSQFLAVRELGCPKRP